MSWSLSCELFFYLCLPFVLPVLRRLRPAALWAVVVAAPLLIVALWPGQRLVPEESRWWFTQIFPRGAVAGVLDGRGRGRADAPGPLAGAGPARWPALLFVATWVAAAQWIRAELWAGLLAVAYLLVITAAADADVRGRCVAVAVPADGLAR